MHMPRDYLIAIILAVAGLSAAAVSVVAPNYLHLSAKAVSNTFWVGIALTVIFLLAAAVIALRAGYEKPKGGPSVSGKNSVNISGSNNTVTIGHIGDVNVNVPGPELKLGNAQGKQNPDGSFMAVFDAQVVAPYPPGSLRIEAWAPGITSLDVVAQRTGMQNLGHSGVRPDHAFKTVMSPFGNYKISVTTKMPTDVDIRYAFDQ